MQPALNAFYRIISAGLNTNSYKFALARALVRLAPGTDPKQPSISRAELAPIFVDYYWPLTVIYRIRQGIDPEKDPIVMKKIHGLMDRGLVSSGEALADFREVIPSITSGSCCWRRERRIEVVGSCCLDNGQRAANDSVTRSRCLRPLATARAWRYRVTVGAEGRCGTSVGGATRSSTATSTRRCGSSTSSCSYATELRRRS